MESFVPNKQHFREVALHYFILQKSAAKTYRILSEVYGKDCPSTKTFEYWFRRFKSHDFDVNDKKHSGARKKVSDEKLKALIEQNPYQTPKELATALNVSRQCISQRLHAMGIVKKEVQRPFKKTNFENTQSLTSSWEFDGPSALKKVAKFCKEDSSQEDKIKGSKAIAEINNSPELPKTMNITSKSLKSKGFEKLSGNAMA